MVLIGKSFVEILNNYSEKHFYETLTRIKNNREKDPIIKQLQTEIENLNKKLESTVNATSVKRKQKSSSVHSTKVHRMYVDLMKYLFSE